MSRQEHKPLTCPKCGSESLELGMHSHLLGSFWGLLVGFGPFVLLFVILLLPVDVFLSLSGRGVLGMLFAAMLVVAVAFTVFPIEPTILGWKLTCNGCGNVRRLKAPKSRFLTSTLPAALPHELAGSNFNVAKGMRFPNVCPQCGYKTAMPVYSLAWGVAALIGTVALIFGTLWLAPDFYQLIEMRNEWIVPAAMMGTVLAVSVVSIVIARLECITCGYRGPLRQKKPRK